jgi:hypothetical protein
MVAVLGTLTLVGMGLLLVWFVRRVQGRLKESEYEGLGPARWRNFGVISSFVSLFPSWSRSRRSEVDDDEENAETRPLLE